MTKLNDEIELTQNSLITEKTTEIPNKMWEKADRNEKDKNVTNGSHANWHKKSKKSSNWR